MNDGRMNHTEPDSSSLRRAVAFLLPVRGGAVGEPANARRAVHWFVPIGLGVGAVYAVVFAGVWSAYGEYFGLRLLPAVVLLAADASFFGHRLIRGACETADAIFPGLAPSSHAIRPAVFVLVLSLLVKFALLLALPRGQYWLPGDWRRHWMFLYPQPVLRPLILMAAWGRWAVLLAMSLGRARTGEDRVLLGMMAGARIGVVLAWLLPCVVLTVVYCSVLRNVAAGLLVSGITLAGTYAVAVLFSWRLGGQTRASVYAAGAAGELVFLFAYVPFGSRILGY
ncbi:MAG: hypothetical protein ACPMAQ_12435 [Phycisphaerae bacterium]